MNKIYCINDFIVESDSQQELFKKVNPRYHQYIKQENNKYVIYASDILKNSSLKDLLFFLRQLFKKRVKYVGKFNQYPLTYNTIIVQNYVFEKEVW